MDKITVTLSPHYTELLEKIVSSGEYSSVQAAIEEALCLLEARDSAPPPHVQLGMTEEELRRELAKADGAEVSLFDAEEFIAEMHEKYLKKAQTQA